MMLGYCDEGLGWPAAAVILGFIALLALVVWLAARS